MMPLFLVLAIAAPMPTASSCPGTTTLAINACLKARFEKSDATLNRYYRAALARLGGEGESKASDELVQAERSWIAYRDSECGAVFEHWSGGTIRVSMDFDCRIRITRLRTYTIWRDWLTYPDSTPPLLSRPDVDSAVSDRGR